MAGQTPSPIPPPGEAPASSVRARRRVADEGERRFEAFVLAQVKDVAQWGRRLRADADAAADWLQICFAVLAWKRAKVPEARWEAWLHVAMRFRKLVHLRSLRRAAAHEQDVHAALYEGREGTSPEEDFHQRECERELDVLLESLPPSLRAVARARLVEELSNVEIAQQLGVSLNTTKDRYRAARLAMAEANKRAEAKEESEQRLPAFLAALAAAALLFTLWLRRLGAAGLRALAARSLEGERSPRSEAAGRSGWWKAGAAVTACAATMLAAGAALQRPPRLAPAEEAAVEPSFAVSFAACAPFLATNAEREREWLPRAETRAVPRASGSRSKSNAGGEWARDLLLRATTSLQEGHIAHARLALRDYERLFPENPCPAQHAQLAAALGPH